ncbi:MAG: 2-C-methyl-D-erythritol 2,4-cyclodiphosphate synthase [Oscillospiraceae bacterium]|nr:2-C-methyl-D-erythritol 2,4-cyclodiphosphate synthase [Oscillospiraceae bacterium]
MITGLRIGHGYDAHRLVAGCDMILCGVKIPCEYGPDGHSDADAPLHALTDAILGAAVLGDIGAHFPDTDPALRGASSARLLTQAYGKVKSAGYELVNADITIILQAPRIAQHINQMREAVAAALGCDAERINVKATTEEKMGFTGSGEGIAAHAVVLLAAAS